MTFVAEDGTGVENATSYVAVEAADAYWTARNNSSWGTVAAEAKQAALLQATAFVEGSYRGSWSGTIAKEEQGLAWPRVGASDPDGRTLRGVPRQISDAVCELALEALSGPLLPALDRGGRVKRETIGPITTEYDTGAPGGKVYPVVEVLLAGLVRTSRSSIPLRRR